MKKRFSREQIIGFPDEADPGVPVKDLCGKHGFSDAALYGWRTRFRGMKVEEARRLEALEHENVRLKRLRAHSMLDSGAPKAALGRQR